MTSTLPKARPVLIFNRRKKLTVIASSINEAAKYANRSPGNISKVCNGKHISDGNYYYRYIDDNVEIDFSGQLQKSVDALGGGLTKYIAQAVYEERKIRHSSHL